MINRYINRKHIKYKYLTRSSLRIIKKIKWQLFIFSKHYSIFKKKWRADIIYDMILYLWYYMILIIIILVIKI